MAAGTIILFFAEGYQRETKTRSSSVLIYVRALELL